MSKSTEELLRDLESGGTRYGSTAVAPVRKTSPARRNLRDSTVIHLIAAVILIAVIGSLPIISLALYPFGVFVTLLHETGHAFAATLTGGSVTGISVSPNLSGLTTSIGGVQALIAPAGYLGATAAGAAILLTPLRFSRWVLGALALVPIAALATFHPTSFFTAAWCIVFATSLVAAAWKLPARLRGFLQIFLGVEAGLNAFRDLMTLLFISGSSAHLQTDADAMSRALFLPSIVWAVAWTVISVLLLAGTLALLIRRDLSQLRG